MENNKKNKRALAVLAVVAVVAIAFAGIGYAYTSTTVSTSNSVASEDILVLLYADDQLQTEKYDYSEDVQKVKYNNYIRGMDDQGVKDIVYGVAEDAQILSINTIVLKSEGLVDDENPTGEKQLEQLTLILSQDLFADGTTYTAADFVVKLTAGDNVWTGDNEGKTWIFTKSGEEQDGDNLVATEAGSAYVLSFVLKADPEMDLEVLGTADEAAAVEECYPHDKKLEEVIDSETPLKIYFVAESLEA